MGTYFKKDVLVYWRDRKEIIISLLLPLVLIVVMALALPNWIEHAASTADVKVALVVEDDEMKGLEQFKESIAAGSNVPKYALQHMIEQADQLSPIRMLRQLFRSEQISQVLEVVETDRQAALDALGAGEATAVVTVPDGYTLAVLNQMFLAEGDGGQLAITAEKAGMPVDIVYGVVAGFAHQVHFQASIDRALAQHSGMTSGTEFNNDTVWDERTMRLGGYEEIPGFKKLTAYQYFTLAIGILFSLFISMTTSYKAMTEKRERVLHRMLLSGTRATQYLLGKASSAFVLSLIQMGVILMFTHFVLRAFPDRSLSFWIGLSLILVTVGVCVASLSALFTTLVFRMNDEKANTIILVAVIFAGTIGGSFVPLYILPDWLQIAGGWTPNGLALSASIKWLQAETYSDLMVPLTVLCGFAIIVTAVSIGLFPKRGRMG